MCCIENLPYDVLVEIFSNLSVKDILSSAERVCRRWKEACHDIHTWKHQLYQPSNKNNDAILEELQRMPKLQGLLLEHDLENDFFSAFIGTCPYLRTLIITRKCVFDCEMVQTLRSNCPNIVELQIPIGKSSGNLILEEVVRLANLKTLILRAINPVLIDVKLLADGCPSLERISFWKLSSLKEDLIYFLQKKGGTLRQLEISCALVARECLLPLLSTCKKLDWLHIECWCEFFEVLGKRHRNRASIGNREDDGVEKAIEQPLDLQNLQTVTSLSFMYLGSDGREDIRQMGMELFRSHCLSQLVSLNLNIQDDQTKQIIDSVAENCPLLKKLHLYCCCELADDCLMNLPSLPFLEDVSLENSRLAKEDSIHYLSSCLNLQYLNLTRCFMLGECAMRKIVTLSNLKRLILDWCDVRGFPFHLVSDHMKYLTYISLYKSKHVDWKGVEELKEKNRLVTIVQKPPIRYVDCSPMLGKFPIESPNDDDYDCAT